MTVFAELPFFRL